MVQISARRARIVQGEQDMNKVYTKQTKCEWCENLLRKDRKIWTWLWNKECCNIRDFWKSAARTRTTSDSARAPSFIKRIVLYALVSFGAGKTFNIELVLWRDRWCGDYRCVELRKRLRGSRTNRVNHSGRSDVAQRLEENPNPGETLTGWILCT